ncbi:hypothetical protein HHI36_000963 [Cryptolaemus montrouzieri]|uniref:Uncharacterized protein n=1 Tax=Cryptolaemus montrouzieri TaxID=559131 RepID=A0ABD2P6Y1_9CUCU
MNLEDKQIIAQQKTQKSKYSESLKVANNTNHDTDKWTIVNKKHKTINTIESTKSERTGLKGAFEFVDFHVNRLDPSSQEEDVKTFLKPNHFSMNLRAIDISKFNIDENDVDWNAVIDISELEQQVKKLDGIILFLFDKHAPVESSRKSKNEANLI